MQLDPQRFLDLCEKSNSLCFWDIESTGTKGDYNSILVLSVKPYDKPTQTFSIEQVGNDRRVVRESRDFLEQFDCWATYYGKGFDLPMLNTRLLRWKLAPVDKRPHIDLYYTLKYNLLTGRKSQAHLLEWLDTKQKKMTVGADVWSSVGYNTKKAMKTLKERCESDVGGLEELYKQTRHLVADIKK